MTIEAPAKSHSSACRTTYDAINRRHHRAIALPGTLLVHVGVEGVPDVLKEAVHLAERANASLIGVAAEASVPDTWGIQPVPGSYLAASRVDLLERLKETKTRFKSEAASLGGRAHWYGEVEEPHRALCQHACGADWLIARRPREVTDKLCAPHVADLLMGAGIPVLLLGNDAEPLDAFRIVLGWKDSREARRAVAAAMPFLLTAQEVILTNVVGDGDLAYCPGRDEVERRLLDRGCHVTVVNEPVCGGSVAATLAHVAATRGADLIVVGGYAHSRLREWVLGGVTHDLIRACAFHVLFCH